LWLGLNVNYSTETKLYRSIWKATFNTWCTRCIFIFCRSMVCINTVKFSGVSISL